MNYRLKNPMHVPTDKFYYIQPETGFRSKEQTLQEAIEDTLQHRRANGLERANYEDVSHDVQNQICQRVGDQWCDNMKVGSWNFPLTIEKVIKFTRMLATFAKAYATGESPYVDKEEAERRARICSKCFCNQPGSGCVGCGIGKMFEDLARETGGGHTTSVDDKLNSCHICSCFNRVQVHIRGDILKASMIDKEREAYSEVRNCWKAEL